MQKTVQGIVLFFSISIGIGCFQAGWANESEPLKVVMQYFSVPPHVYIDKDTGKVSGAVYEFINDYIAPETGIIFTWDKAPKTILRQLVATRTHPGYACALIVYSPNREDVCEYTHHPYHISHSAIVVLGSSPLDQIHAVENILGMTVGYTHNAYLTYFMRDKRVRFEMTDHADFMKINIQKLLSGEIDAVYAPDLASLLMMARQMHMNKGLKAIHLPELPVPFHVVFSKGATQLVEKYNQAFDKLDGQVLYLSLLVKYLDISLLN